MSKSSIPDVGVELGGTEQVVLNHRAIQDSGAIGEKGFLRREETRKIADRDGGGGGGGGGDDDADDEDAVPPEGVW